MNIHDINLERNILGAIIFNNETRLLIVNELEAEDFFYLPHITLWLSMRDMLKREIVPTVENLMFELQAKQQKDAFMLVPELYDMKLPEAYIRESIAKLKQLAFYRTVVKQVSSGLEILKQISPHTQERLETWFESQRRLFSNRLKTDKPNAIQEILANAYENPKRTFLEDLQLRQEMHKRGEKVFSGYPTHFIDFDRFFDGFQKGHLTIIGARPGVGKTSFMLNLVINQIFQNKTKIGIFSLEMPALSIAEKMVFIRARIDYRNAKSGVIQPTQFNELYGAVKAFAGHCVLIDDTAKINIYTLTNRIKHWIDSNQVQIVFIDYLQLISATDRNRSKYEQITEISQQLKIIAKEADIPIVCLAQLNRNAVATKDTKPRVSDLRDSGAIEQDADEILLLDCPSLETPTEKPGLLMVNIGKNRFGQTGDFQLVFEKNTGFMGNYSPLIVNRLDELEDAHDAFHQFKN